MILVPDPVKTPRTYRSPLRAEQAAATRQQVLAAAWRLFTTQGYAATTVAEVAAAAGVSVDTLYATIGRKSLLLREVVESAISGTPAAVVADEREYVRRVQATEDPAAAIRIYADAITEMSPRTGPILAALRDAAGTDPACALLHSEISGRRAANMLRFAAHLRRRDGLRAEVSDQYAADVIWATAGFEHYLQLVHERGWTPEEFGDYLAQTWTRTLLQPSPGA